ncbi:MAG: hypothetical protein AAGG09_00235 [Pseudomonadota bacterium]
MFDTARPEPDAVARLKALIVERFALPETTMVSVAELRCHEPGCPPVETVVTARGDDGTVEDWRIAKPLSDIAADDVDGLSRV